MASQKVRKLALQRLFKTSAYNMYAFTLEQPLRLGVRNFYLAILFVFARPSICLLLFIILFLSGATEGFRIVWLSAMVEL